MMGLSRGDVIRSSPMTAREQRVGPWLLREQLGRGGNASVWAATHCEDGTTAAVKLINTKKVDREPYRRFVREIEFLRAHQEVRGLLPLVGAHLPDELTKDD